MSLPFKIWSRQPPANTQVFKSGVGRGLVSAPNWSSGISTKGFFDKASDIADWTLGGNETIVQTIHGRALSYTTAGTGGMRRPVPFQPDTPFTALFLINTVTSIPLVQITAFSFATDLDQIPLLIVRQALVTGNLELFQRDSGGGGAATLDSGVQLTAGQFYACAFRTNGTTTWELFISGKWTKVTASSGGAMNSNNYAIGGLYRGAWSNQSGLDQIVGPYLFNRQLTDAEVDAWAKNSWNLFQPIRKKIFIVPAGATNTYTITPTGSVVFSNTVPLIRTRQQNPTGLISFSGAVPLVRTRQQNPSGVISFSGAVPILRIRQQNPSGSVVFSGTSPLTFSSSNTYTITPSGAVTFSGTVPLLRARVITPSGAFVFSGNSPLVRTHTSVPSGQVIFSGSAPINFLPAGGPTNAIISRITIGLDKTTGVS